MDLDTKRYMSLGSSIKSEREANDRPIKRLSFTGIEMNSIRRDIYYSSPSYMDKLGNTKVFIMQKKNATLNGSRKWKNDIVTWKSITREAIQNRDSQRTRR